MAILRVSLWQLFLELHNAVGTYEKIQETRTVNKSGFACITETEPLSLQDWQIRSCMAVIRTPSLQAQGPMIKVLAHQFFYTPVTSSWCMIY